MTPVSLQRLARPTDRGWAVSAGLSTMQETAQYFTEKTMKNSIRSCLTVLGLALSLATSSASAATVETRFGAQDGFGVGIASGDVFAPFELVAGLGDGADEWREGGLSITLSSSWIGMLTGARLEVFSGGWGLGAAAEVLVNNQLVGLLTLADADTVGDNFAFLDAFDLSPLSLITGTDVIEIRTASTVDAGVLGYLKLTLQTQDATGNAVPEPASVALAGIALAGALLARRRRRD